MEKFLALLDKVAAAVAAIDPALAKELADDIQDVRETLKRPNAANRIWQWLINHGNLPGTPESRGETDPE